MEPVSAKKALLRLSRLFNHWGISPHNWILTAQYAFLLLGYDVQVRPGHFNIQVQREKLPWNPGNVLESHPPDKSVFQKEIQQFLKKTGFEFDIVPLSEKNFSKSVSEAQQIALTKNIKIFVQTPTAMAQEVDELMSECTNSGWGEEKGRRVYPSIENQRNALLKKGEFKVAHLYTKLLKKYRKFKVKEEVRLDLTGILSGIPASNGIAEGTARVILNASSLKRNFSKNEVLVTLMTSPKYHYLANHAAAIVTDEGGMLCHAAILARELAIPCVVGTKKATKFLKNGDRIRVNGNKGIISKI